MFDGDIVKFVQSANASQLQSYVAMERFSTVNHRNMLVRAGQQLQLDNMDTEFGTFGFVLGTEGGCVLQQDQRGHLMRTKPAKDREGGTIKGTAGHDAPFLVFE